MDVHKGPTVDILMATYNGEKYVAQQIDSILSQSYANFNIIIADDNSVDNTKEILTYYSSIDRRVRLIFNESNLGVKKNFEKLLSFSDAEYFMLCDQDDIWNNEKIEKSLKFISSIESLLIYTDLRVVDHNLKIIGNSFWSYSNIKAIDGKVWKILFSQNIVTGCTIMAKRDLIKLALPFPDNIHMHDAWLAIIASAYGSISNLPEQLVEYRQHKFNSIGAMKFGHPFSKSETNRFQNYSNFLINRKLYIQSKIDEINCYKLWFETKNYNKKLEDTIIKGLGYLLKTLEKLLNVKYLNFGHEILIKARFPSQGILRNIWWSIYLNIPVLIYVYLLINIFIKKVRQIE